MTALRPPWLAEPPVQRLLAALTAANVDARFVGGCVRDALLDITGGDIDLATPAPPDTVMAALKRAKIKAIPTGLAHGTVTAVIAPRQFEITTLRRDVETDGRHAKVAFDAGWAEDAARRDFTVNAIYMAPDGTLFDPVGGQADLTAHRVRFVGDPAKRIDEDVLRILRYYRFEARFGAGEGNADARTACRDAAAKLPSLSAERVWRELSRLLAGPDPVRVLKLMRDDGVLAAVLPEATRIDRLEKLVPLSDDPLLRLAALVDVDVEGAASIVARLRLSNADQQRVAGLVKPWLLVPDTDARAQRLSLYRLGREVFCDLAALLAAEGQVTPRQLNEMRRLAETWPIPSFPLGGEDVIALGIAPGPRVGRLLAAVKRWWEDGDFTADRPQCLAKLKELAERS
jgi:poly(A) polymerase